MWRSVDQGPLSSVSWSPRQWAAPWSATGCSAGYGTSSALGWSCSRLEPGWWFALCRLLPPRRAPSWTSTSPRHCGPHSPRPARPARGRRDRGEGWSGVAQPSPCSAADAARACLPALALPALRRILPLLPLVLCLRGAGAARSRCRPRHLADPASSVEVPPVEPWRRGRGSTVQAGRDCLAATRGRRCSASPPHRRPRGRLRDGRLTHGSPRWRSSSRSSTSWPGSWSSSTRC